MPAQPLTPPDRSALWLRLRLTKHQLAALTGVSARQVGYWAARGYLPTAPGRAGCYNGDAADLCALIKGAIAQGLPLRTGVAQARRVLADELADQPALSALAALDPAARVRLGEQLVGARAATATVLQQVAAVAPPHDLREAGHRGEHTTRPR